MLALQVVVCLVSLVLSLSQFYLPFNVLVNLLSELLEKDIDLDT